MDHKHHTLEETVVGGLHRLIKIINNSTSRGILYMMQTEPVIPQVRSNTNNYQLSSDGNLSLLVAFSGFLF